MAGLSAAEGGFTTPLGWFGTKWTASKKVFKLDIDVPQGTLGIITWPVSGRTTVEGKKVMVKKGDTFEISGGKKSFEVKST
jgi:hypothetical protein